MKMLLQSRHTIVVVLGIVLLLGLPCIAIASDAPACTVSKERERLASQLLADGDKAFEAGEFSKAESAWLEVRACGRETRDWPKAVFNLGLLAYRRKNPTTAIGYFDEVLSSHPNDKEPGGRLMETNRNYSYRSALAISECYEEMGAYWPALHYAWLTKTKYRFYSWCGTCSQSANFAVDKQIVYLTVRALRLHLWACLAVGLFAIRRWRVKSDKTPAPD